MATKIYDPLTPDEIIDNYIIPEIKRWFSENIHLILVEKEFLENYEVYEPLDFDWFAIVNGKLRVERYGIEKVTLGSLELINAKFFVMYKRKYVANIIATFYQKNKSVTIDNPQQVINSINCSICPKCKNPKKTCTCKIAKTSPQENEIKIKFENSNLTNDVELYDNTGLFSKKEIVYNLSKEKIEEIIDSIAKSLGYKKQDLWSKALDILKSNPQIDENALTTKLVLKTNKE